MYIAMNRFKVLPGAESEFETLWLNRESKLREVPGFVKFHMLRGPGREGHTLYASHTIWESPATFQAWTKSEAFRAAHGSAGSTRPLYEGHPEFEGFEVIQTIGAAD
ncbi:antibiotic biosynthesis monooxygenase family protein [Aurantimonas marina]|uniref:antibiotic biosynthesis monooxygenase family protein n=1 Tax=Aurantimonas marina TaxID=2780508 RepID=UPI0019D0B620|nr:antibiotic biosynthesis monooxygenase [Aurantimonas marina]